MSSPSIEQAIRNNLKVARSIVRLKHAIEADEELAAIIPELRLRLERQAADGRVTGLGYEELRMLLYGAGD